MIRNFLTQNRKRFGEELKTFVRFASVSAQPQHRKDLLQCARWLETHLRQLGLQTKLHATLGHPILVATTPKLPHSHFPTLLIYGHYDVQPPEPLELWKTPPFEPTIRGQNLYGRGASDNKGQIFAHIKAVESYLKTQTPLPVNVIFLLEGEEEIGSGHLMTFVRQHARELRADAILISDSGMYDKQHPAITYGTRGIAALEVRVDGPARDLHSGVFGGSVANPALVLSQLLASCVDARGRVTIRGFYAEVAPLAPWERREFARLPFREKKYAEFLGVSMIAGEKGYSTLERRWARPTLEINGLTSGYQGAGSKTIVPASASAKITCRLVPNQNPKKIAKLVAQHMRQHCPQTVRLTVTEGHHAPPFLEAPTSAATRAAVTAVKQAFRRKPVFIREGGTLPILDVFKRHLRAPILLVGLGLPDDNWHSPNEKMDLDNFHKGIMMSAILMKELGKV